MKKTLIKKLITATIAVSMVASLAGCSGSSSSTSSTASDSSKSSASTSGTTSSSAKSTKTVKKLGFVAMDLANQVFVQTIEGAQAYADENGYELNVVDGASSAEKQVTGMENLVQMGCDCIDLRAIDSSALADSVKAASDAGVYVSTYPEIEGCTAVLKYDDYDQGAKLAEAAADWINTKLGGKAEVAFLEQPAVDAVMERVSGFKDVLAKECPNATIVAEEEGHETDTGMKAMESILQAHPNVKVVLCVNDSGALGAYEALNSSGKDLSDVFLGGIDGTDAALQKVEENGVYRATVAGKLMFQEIGYSIMQNIVNAAEGKDYVKDYTVEVMAITADNVAAYKSRTPDYAALKK